MEECLNLSLCITESKTALFRPKVHGESNEKLYEGRALVGCVCVQGVTYGKIARRRFNDPNCDLSTQKV